MTAEKSQNVQDVFLNHVRKNKTPVTIFLVNGVKLQGIITWFDNFSVLLRRDGHSQLVYKHAISTVMPTAPISLFEGDKERRQADVTQRRTATARALDGRGTGRCLVLHPDPEERARGRARPPEAQPREAVGLARRDRPRRRARRGRAAAAPAAGDPARQRCRSSGFGELVGAERRSRWSWSTRTLSPVQQRNLETGLEVQGHRPHRPDPRDLRRAGAHRGRPPAGRAGVAHLPALPPGADLDPPRAPARRLRLPGRPRRDPARSRPPHARRPHRASSSASSEQVRRTRGLHREARAARALPGRGPGRLHQRRQVDAVQPPGQRPGAGRRHAVRHARSDHARAGAALGRARSSCPTRSASSPTCRPTSSRPSAPRWKRCRAPTSSCMCATSPIPETDAQRADVHRVLAELGLCEQSSTTG